MGWCSSRERQHGQPEWRVKEQVLEEEEKGGGSGCWEGGRTSSDLASSFKALPNKDMREQAHMAPTVLFQCGTRVGQGS